MRFLAGGPDIPDELLYAQDEGKVVFFCGAGVSVAYAGLPSFAKLAGKVITGLGATDDSKASRLFLEAKTLNEDTHARGTISADSIFTALARDFEIDDIHRYVAQNLTNHRKASNYLDAHKIILNLAGWHKNEVKLVTTNFDLLFEAVNKNIDSATLSNIPNIKYANDNWGIVHLHGKVNEDYSGPDKDSFVLLSSEFGDAYLARGWARDFVKDILEKYTAVFIGYSASDPPVQYLLEGLQQSGETPHGIYAFQESNDEAMKQWREKGAIPISYNLKKDEEYEHAYLWDSLRAWVKRSKNPKVWKEKVISKAKERPGKLEAHERGMIAHLVKSKFGARLFAERKPAISSEWLCVFDKNIRLGKIELGNSISSHSEAVYTRDLYMLDNDPPPKNDTREYIQGVYNKKEKGWDAFSLNSSDFEGLKKSQVIALDGIRENQPEKLPKRLKYLIFWIGEVAHENIAVWWAGQQPSLHPHLLDHVKKSLGYKGKNVSEVVIESWDAVLELNNLGNRKDFQQYELGERITRLGWNDFVLSEYSKISAPCLKRSILNNFPVPKNNKKKIDRNALVRIQTDYPENIHKVEVSNDYLPQVVNSLRINLEQAIDMRKDISGPVSDFLHADLSDSPKNDDLRGDDFFGYVFNFKNLFADFVNVQEKMAKEEFKRWRKNDSIFNRLRVWACGLPNFLNETEFTNEILSLPNNAFWTFHGERDLLLSLQNRWNELHKDDIEKIERRILDIPKINDPMHSVYSLEDFHHKILNRLHWLSNQGCNLDLDLEEQTEMLQLKAPNWMPRYAGEIGKAKQRADATWVKVEKDWSQLRGLSFMEIIEKVKNPEELEIPNFTMYRPFEGLSEDKPVKALAALLVALRKNKFYEDLWETYLSSDARDHDNSQLVLLIALIIIKISNENFKEIISTSSRWFFKHGESIKKENSKIFERLWEKFVMTIREYPYSASSTLSRQANEEVDWVTEAINSPAGKLAELHMKMFSKKKTKIGRVYPKVWFKKAKQLLRLPEDGHRHAMTIFGNSLNRLYIDNQNWVEENLIKTLECEDVDNSTQYDKDAVFAGYLHNIEVLRNKKLYYKLKPEILKLAKRKRKKNWNYTKSLATFLILGWSTKDRKGERYITDKELREILLLSSENFRSDTLFYFDYWVKFRKKRRSVQIIDFLKYAWPKQKNIRTDYISARLFDFALEQKDNFPAVSREVTKLIKKIEDEPLSIEGIMGLGIDNDEENLARQHPEELLNLLYAILPDHSEKWPYEVSKILEIIKKSEGKLIENRKFMELQERLDDR